ncbi:MAG: two-component sensor histidine kinase [Bacteroidetes bacterium]|nr:two-component sensor histidine kinase [Bacteroidota bacterium]MBL0079640.1 two-component sensor histidine kinase [Bacteroidota bacterium]
MSFTTKITKKQHWIFIFLLTYITIFIIWWSFLLIDKNQRYYALLENAQTIVESEKKGMSIVEEKKKQELMIIAEGLTFLLISWAILFRLRKTLFKEVKLANQQRNFLLSITHELKSPIASALLNTQTQIKRNLDSEKRQLLDTNTEKDLKRLGSLVDKILLAAKVEDNSASFFKEKFNLSQLVNEVFTDWELQWNDKFKFNADVSNDIFISGDKSLINSLISNLLENAIKYSNEGDSILVKLFQNETSVSLFVSDMGKGIPIAEQKQIFNKFYRIGNEETRTTIGTGLGLFIVKQVALMHQAEIEVESEIGNGTIFKIFFRKE